MRLKSVYILQKFHESIILLWFLSLFLFTIFNKTRVFAAFYFLLIGLVNLIWGDCPLTLLEKDLLKKAGVDKKVKNFTPRLFKKYFGFEISYKFVRFFIILFFIISIFYLFDFFS